MNKRYSEREMFAEIKEYVEGLGGTLHELDLSRQIIDMQIPPALEETVLTYLESIIIKYTNKRKELRKSDPFFGVADLLEDLKED